MRYTVLILPRAEKELRRLPSSVEKRIIERLGALENDLQGDVKRLTNHEPAWRLRVGDYRVLFDVAGDRVLVQTIRHRREAYD